MEDADLLLSTQWLRPEPRVTESSSLKNEQFLRLSSLTDLVQITFDLIAMIAFVVFTALSLTLVGSMKGSALKRGFWFASIAGIVHVVGNLLTVIGDFGLVASNIPMIAFSTIQALFAVLLALAVQSFFPSWYKAFKKSTGNSPLPSLTQ